MQTITIVGKDSVKLKDFKQMLLDNGYEVVHFEDEVDLFEDDSCVADKLLFWEE